MRIFALLLILLLLTGSAVAQQATPARPMPTPTPTAIPTPEDARLALCRAPLLDGFVPHIIQPGERLADLLRGVPNISVTQLAALNCIDDPSALPVGGVVWVPVRALVEAEAGAGTGEPARIDLFEPDATLVQNEAGVSFRWQAAGDVAYFYPCPVDGPCTRPLNAEPVPLTYTTATISGFQYAGPVRYRLEVLGGGASVTADAEVQIACSQESLGPSSGERACPAQPPLAVAGAWQPFEGGVMMWFADTQEIWVLTNGNQHVQVVADPFVEGMADPQADAPPDRFTPVRGFGQVWQAQGGADSPLGWALAPETGLDSARQPAGRLSFTTYIQGPGDTVYAVTMIPEREIGYWSQVR